MWRKYLDLEPVKRLPYEGRELLGNHVILTEKRDGQNVSLWKDEKGEKHIASKNLKIADDNIQNRLKSVPEYERALDLLDYEYEDNIVIFGELLLPFSPTRIEPNKKHLHWVLFDIYDFDENRFISYTRLHQLAHSFRIPVPRVVDNFIPLSMEELEEKIEEALKWCRIHHREGFVGKDYKNQIFFKEKIDLPKIKKIGKKKKSKKPELPVMPDEKVYRALQHAFDEVGEDDWKDKSVAMPVFARHVSTEAREHNYSMPRNIYRYYVNTSIEKLKDVNYKEDGNVENGNSTKAR